MKTEADVASRLGVIYMSTMFVGVICFQTTIPAGSKERIVFYREQVTRADLVSSNIGDFALYETLSRVGVC